jgi:1-acyl-sn-glycerol-3-phosphate acyltransferase
VIRQVVIAAGLVWRTVTGVAELVFASVSGVPPGSAVYEEVPRRWAHDLIVASGLTVHVVGREHLDGVGACVYCSSHGSFIDPGALLEALPGSVRFVAKRELFRVPGFGTALRLSGQIPLDRTDKDAAVDALSGAVQVLRSGKSAAIFVEGTRSRAGALQAFKKGAFVLAIQAQVPCVPVYIAGAQQLMPRGGFVPDPGTVEVRIGAPIPTSGLTYEDRDALRERCWNAMAALARA